MIKNSEQLVHEILKDRCVLIISEHIYLRAIFKSYISAIPGIMVQEAAEGSSALYCLNDTNKKIILAVSDIKVPNITGFEILKRIRAGDTRAPRNLPIIMIGKEASFKHRTIADALAASAYITKPVTYDQFLDTIIRALEKDIPIMPSKEYDKIQIDPE
jgi:DNA-binding response OmpR family regulator